MNSTIVPIARLCAHVFVNVVFCLSDSFSRVGCVHPFADGFQVSTNNYLTPPFGPALFIGKSKDVA